ncbi:NUDIX hydrolase [Eubacteriales bacterium KG127]
MSFKEKTILSEKKYIGKILNLRIDKVETKAGTSTREIIEHNGGAVILPLLENKHVVMIKQYRKPVDREVLELPAGKIDNGETPLEAAKRELKEETGFIAGNLKFLTKMLPTVGYSEEILYLYLAQDLIPGETNLDENEDIDMVTYHIDDLTDMILNGKIHDGKTQVAILMAKEMLNRGEM